MEREFRRQDFYTGLILSAVSLGVITESWRMPRTLQGWPAYAGPGVVPGMLGLGLLVMALALTVRSVRGAGSPLEIHQRDAWAYLSDTGTKRLGLMLGLSAFYCLFLGHGFPYWMTTGAYLLLVMVVFRAGPWWQILLIAASATGAITFTFGRIFAVPLP
jgi:putative tricarboxylic transport membrane protein